MGGDNMSEKKENEMFLYQDVNGDTKISVRFANEDLWLTENQIAEIYDTTRQNINLHITNIYKENELPVNSTRKFFLRVQTEGQRQVQREVNHYNLDMILAIGYRVSSHIATRFRQWATAILHEFIQKGFALDDERLKQRGNRYFKELLQRIRDIRSSERNFYQQVTDIYATSIDYDPQAQLTRTFFATVQNKLHFAVHQHTAAELVYKRVDSDKPNVGMTNFKGEYVTIDDTKTAKNYLSLKELEILNLLVSQFLDFAELQAIREKSMKMSDWIEQLDKQLIASSFEILKDKGTVSHDQAMKKAEQEYRAYRDKEMKMLESDFDKAIKLITQRTIFLDSEE
jgi:hypothetical protein